MAAFIIFPKLETRFNTHYQNAYANAFRNTTLELSRKYESRGRPCHCAAALRSLTRGAEIM